MKFQLDETSDLSIISTGHLPPAERVQALVDAAYERYKSNNEGRNAQHYPALARVPGHFFGLCIVATDGSFYSAGDTLVPFTIMSVSKPFVAVIVYVGLRGFKKSARELES